MASLAKPLRDCSLFQWLQQLHGGLNSVVSKLFFTSKLRRDSRSASHRKAPLVISRWSFHSLPLPHRSQIVHSKCRVRCIAAVSAPSDSSVLQYIRVPCSTRMETPAFRAWTGHIPPGVVMWKPIPGRRWMSLLARRCGT